MLELAVVAALAGCLVLSFTLTALAAAGLPWGPSSLFLAAAVAALGGELARRAAGRARLRLAPPARPGGGDAAALFALLVFALFAAASWVALPDFVYHWGLKGHRFFLAHTLDYAYLQNAANWPIHPDYPNLLPELFAATALLTGRFDEPAMMLWSVFFLGLILLSARGTLERVGATGGLLQVMVGILGLSCAATGIGLQGAGGADWMIGLALVAALPPLLSPVDFVGDLELGVIAAFAAASKVEGVPLAVILILVQLARHGIAAMASRHVQREPWRHRLAGIAALLLPAILVVLPWLWAVARHQLFQAYNAGPFQPRRASIILPALLDVLALPRWRGFFCFLGILPLAALARRLRPAGLVLALQLLFYLYVYFSVRIDPVPLIQTSFSRLLLLQLLPALITLTGVAVTRLSVLRVLRGRWSNGAGA